MISKSCVGCNAIHSMTEFTVDRSKKDGRSIYCGSCRRKSSRKAKSKPEAKAKRRSDSVKYREYNRNYSLKSRYGITTEDFNRILESQGNRCAICRTQESSGPGNKFVVDHSLSSGKIRGVLCNKCNVGLGAASDSKEILLSMIRYLEDNDVGTV